MAATAPTKDGCKVTNADGTTYVFYKGHEPNPCDDGESQVHGYHSFSKEDIRKKLGVDKVYFDWDGDNHDDYPRVSFVIVVDYFIIYLFVCVLTFLVTRNVMAAFFLFFSFRFFFSSFSTGERKAQRAPRYARQFASESSTSR